MLSVTEEGASLQQAIVQLQLMRPAPSLVLVCGDMGIYSRFIHGLIANSQTFYWVMSCFPFGRELQGSVKGSQLAYNFLEPMPWPPLQQIEAVDQAMAEIQEAIAQTIPGLSLASLTSQQPNLNMQMLALRAAVQMLYQAVYKGMTSWFLYQTSTVGVLQPDGANTSLQDGGIDYLVTALKTPLKISSFTHDTYFTYFGQRNFDQQGHVIASRYETGLRQFIPLANISEISKRDPVKIKGSWRYNHARHLFREFSFDETLEPNRLDFLSNKLIYTYPCPAGCVVVGLDCSACPPGFFRQASGVGCAPCPANASVFYNFWAGPQCFPCPHGSRCDRPDEAPVALPGYLLLADPAAKNLGGRGLLGGAWDLSRWYELKAQTFWIVEECFPQTACAGQNQCAQFHYGDKCSICSPGSSKFEGYFCRVDCAECPQVAALVFQTLVLAAFQVISILLLSLAIRDSAWNVHSISGPVVIALLRALLIHAITVPSLSFYSLYLMQCDGTQLYKQRDMACPDLVNLGNGYVLFHIIVMQLVTKSIALSLGLLHIWVIFLLTALESRVGLVLNMNSRPSSRFTLRLSRLTRCFASSYSMLVQRKSGGQLVFDARHIPKRFRMVFMQGVASAVNFILHRNSILRIVDVRNMVPQATQGLNAAYARSLFKGEVDEPDEAFAAILGSELIAAYELVSAIEDMCSGYFSSPGRKEKDRAASDPLDDADEDLISKMEKEGFGTQGTMPLATPKKATVFALRRQTAKDRFDKRLFEKAQADCLKAVESILPKVEQLQRQLTEMWLVSDNDHDRLVPAFIDKVESLCSLLKEVKGFFNDERDSWRTAFGIEQKDMKSMDLGEG
eukprot:g11160.t1